MAENTSTHDETTNDAPETGATESEQAEQDNAARYETIRQLALAGELEVSPEVEEYIDTLLDTIRQRDEHFARFQEMAAEHQNYQRRASKNELEARTSATQGVVQSLIPLIDHFDVALTQDPEKVDAKSLISGVELIKSEFIRTLGAYGVKPIAPRVGDEFNPGEHAAMMQHAAEGVEPGHISILVSSGYKLGERVIRPAKVGVAPQSESSDAKADEGDS